MRLVKSMFVFGLFALPVMAGLYYLRLSISEGRIIGPSSIERYILIPDLLLDEKLTRIGVVDHYTSDAADGPKAPRASLKLLIASGRDKAENNIKQYFLMNGFKENQSHELWCEGQEVSMYFEINQPDGLSVDISITDYR
jgi:hypothetical protein